MKIGYVRLADMEQKVDIQQKALESAGCERIFTDIARGKKSSRPELEKALNCLTSNDILVVHSLDRLGNGIADLIRLILFLHTQNIHLVSLKNNLDSRQEDNLFKFFCMLAEYEKNLVLERSEVGLKIAKAHGKLGGRPAKLNVNQVTDMLKIYSMGNETVNELCKKFNISRPSFYNYLRIYKNKFSNKRGESI